MLKKLTVSNLAVVEKAEAEFAPGLNVITGETGAGKSVLMGALELVLGARGDSAVVRTGCREAEVEAEFDGHVLRRTVTAEGRSRAWIDDESVTLQELRTAAEKLVDVHGPRANLKLVESAFQLASVDAFAGAAGAKALADYAAEYAAYADARAALERLRSEAAGEDELELLRFQVGELAEAEVTAADDDLVERHAAAAHAEEIVESANAMEAVLGADEGVEALVERARTQVAVLRRHLPAAAEWEEALDRIAAAAEELSRQIAEAASRLEVDPGEFERMDARLGVISRLRRKYLKTEVGALPSHLAEVLAAKRERLDALEHRAEREAELAQALDAARRRVEAAGARLSRTRAKAAAAFAAAAERELKALGFARAGFTVRLESVQPGPTGMDAVTFMFAPNPGEDARPLAAIASSGEIARVMLAIKAAAATEASAPTLVFDEVDANLGGETGLAVGRKLRAVAARAQVIAITHLPQSAVWGERHLAVAKTVRDGRTRTEISEVSGAARITEVARMLGGEKLTSVTRKHAQELLDIPG